MRRNDTEARQTLLVPLNMQSRTVPRRIWTVVVKGAPGDLVAQRLLRRAQPEKQFESFVDRGEFARRDSSKDPSDSPLVDRSEMVDQGRGLLDETTRARLQ